jgi:hypothetical protein
MPAQDDREYFLRRAREEREIANGSEDNSVALAHLRMADAYECRARELEREACEMPPAIEVRSVALQ